MIKKSAQTICTLVPKPQKTLINPSRALMVDQTDFFANQEFVENRYGDLAKFNTIYNYMKLNGIVIMKSYTKIN